jgi:hypothetical protein
MSKQDTWLLLDKKADELKLLKPKIVLPTRLIGEILP